MSLPKPHLSSHSKRFLQAHHMPASTNVPIAACVVMNIALLNHAPTIIACTYAILLIVMDLAGADGRGCARSQLDARICIAKNLTPFKCATTVVTCVETVL